MNTMFMFPSMLVPHMGKVKFAIPEYKQYAPENYPHWQVFCNLHLGRPIDISTIEYNAKIIDSLTIDQVMEYTWDDYEKAGLDLHSPDYIV